MSNFDLPVRLSIIVAVAFVPALLLGLFSIVLTVLWLWGVAGYWLVRASLWGLEADRREKFDREWRERVDE